MGAGSKPLRPWQVCAGDVIGSGKRVEYVFERYGELYINASDEELVRQGKRTYGEELTRLYDLDLSGESPFTVRPVGQWLHFACHDLVPIHFHAPYLRCIEKEGHLFPDAPSTP